MICHECAWSKVEEEYEYCKIRRAAYPDMKECPKFYSFDWDGESSDIEECEYCHREKDKGRRCWLCGL